jgi:hypothetical protein
MKPGKYPDEFFKQYNKADKASYKKKRAKAVTQSRIQKSIFQFLNAFALIIIKFSMK